MIYILSSMQLTDISSQNILNLFLLKTSFDNELIITVDRTTERENFMQKDDTLHCRRGILII
jgi:hypothetical protein